MLPHTRALVAAASYAFISGRKVAGIHDHLSGQDLRIAAESQGSQLQGFDGDRAVMFGGALPELYDAGENAFVSIEIAGMQTRGFDRKTESAYAAQVSDGMVQVYDYGSAAWFAFSVQVADADAVPAP